MGNIDEFRLFVALPTELRLTVWEEALSTPTACIALPEESNDKCWRLTLASAGTTPYRIGLSCKESWRQMRQMCRRVLCKPLGAPEAVNCVYWFNLESTVFHFDKQVNPTSVLHYFGAVEGLSIKHIALTWDSFDRLARTCQAVAHMLPALRSFSIQRGHLFALLEKLKGKLDDVMLDTLTLQENEDDTADDDVQPLFDLIRDVTTNGKQVKLVTENLEYRSKTFDISITIGDVELLDPEDG